MAFKKLFFLWVLLLLTHAGFSQTDTTQAPYQRFPQVPPFQLLLGDSATFYKKEDLPKGKPVLLMIFSPECSHCQHTAEELVQYKNELKNIQIILATLHPIAQMNAFAATYGLDALPNVVLGKDVYFILPSFYNLHNLPYMAFYNAKGRLIRGIEGALPMDRVIALFKEAKK